MAWRSRVNNRRSMAGMNSTTLEHALSASPRKAVFSKPEKARTLCALLDDQHTRED